MANEFQKQLGKDLKDNGFHVYYDPVTKEKLPKGVRNPKGIKVANCNQHGRVGIVAAGEDPGEAVQFVTDSGYILERHNDGFVAVLEDARIEARDGAKPLPLQRLHAVKQSNPRTFLEPKPALSETIASLDKLWQDQPAPRPPMGQWLIENMPRGIDLELPSRRSNREIPFIDELQNS